MKLVLRRLCFVLVIAANVRVLARIFDKIDRSATQVVRSTAFVPKVAKKLCLLKPQRGPCRAYLDMYYFDPKTLNCSTFTWGGCQGNGNRFDTKDECEDYCKTKRGVRPPVPNFCQLSFDYGYCFGEVKRYYFDPIYKTCKLTIYSGCGGNRNNFYTLENCLSMCLFGNGRVTTKARAGADLEYKTVVIVNPPFTTPPRGLAQTGKDGLNLTLKTFVRKYQNGSGVYFVTVKG
ncbi:tissue factor pathway inhibitor-like [Amyelois transitella]|uniref:tissue factor pathway inhibitor-like n=1 Tax=Amyelois transitella TaxID=680683 RepID=UPI00298F81B5|nr:tissue factor pathway inhibitor-like [Amyelois transitella]